MSDEHHSMQTYVSDMIALERHVRLPFEAQAKDQDFTRYGDASALVERLLKLSQQHIDRLDRCLSDLGGHAGAPIKNSVAQFEGIVAGAIDAMRKTKVSKALRDDYTALALCTAAYTMLQSTALALKEDDVADTAQSHLKDYAECVMSIGESLPEVVLQELRDIGLDVDASMVAPARESAERAWRTAGAAAHTTETGTVSTQGPMDTFANRP